MAMSRESSPKMQHIQTNADLFRFLQQDAPRSYRLAVDGADLKSLGLFHDLMFNGDHGWLVQITRKHGTKFYIAILHAPQELRVKWYTGLPIPWDRYEGDRDGKPGLTNGTLDD